jgi:hypothetical protein
VLLLTGEWATCKVVHWGGPLMLHGFHAIGGMSGSPIVNEHGHAIGLINTGSAGDVYGGPHTNLMHSLPGWAARETGSRARTRMRRR